MMNETRENHNILDLVHACVRVHERRAFAIITNTSHPTAHKR